MGFTCVCILPASENKESKKKLNCIIDKWFHSRAHIHRHIVKRQHHIKGEKRGACKRTNDGMAWKLWYFYHDDVVFQNHRHVKIQHNAAAHLY